MTTIAQIRDRISQRLSGEQTVMIDRLNGAIADTTTEACTVEFQSAGINEGTVIEIDTEQMYVISRTGANVVMLRGWNSTTAATHADNSIVYINPRWAMSEIVQLIGEELLSWPVQLGKVVTEEVTITQGQVQIALANSGGLQINRLLDAQIFNDSRSSRTRRDRIDVKLVRDRDLDELASGYAIQVAAPFSTARTIQVDYLTAYTVSGLTTTSTDLETGVGLDARLLDVLIYGVMWRAMSTREVQRTSEAATVRGDSERVPPTHLTQTSDALKKIRDKRMVEELYRMHDTYPVLMTMGG